MQGAVGKLRHLGNLGIPGRGEGVPVGFDPMGLGHGLDRDVVRFHRPDQPDTAVDLAIVEHDAGGRHLHRGTPRALVDQELRARIGADIKNGLRTENDLERSVARLPLYEKLNSLKIDCTNKTPYETADAILLACGVGT